MEIFGFKKRKAEKLHEQAQALSDEGRDDEAIALYQKAIELDPEKSESYYNIGLIYKYRNRWKESFKYNAAANRLDPEDEAARWNLGIAATALRDWATARTVWRENGITLQDGNGPINEEFGLTPVRLNPDGNGEVVWARRIDPVRAKILNVPLPESGYLPGDIVLHDGAAVGYRMHGGVEKPVFNVLELFECSEYKTFKVTIHANEQREIEELEDIFEECGMIAEDWTTNYRVLCRACSEGRPHQEHDTENESVWVSEHEIGVGAQSEELLRGAIKKWSDANGKTVKGIECVLERPENK
jgi:tetratricopeptide (TPR) repeat protein